ncbi:MAG: glycosyltransferase [Clostridia bacterium]|nr:glycosyltransferase [Clostridia bacterium]
MHNTNNDGSNFSIKERIIKIIKPAITQLKFFAIKHRTLLKLLIILKSFLLGGPKGVKNKLNDFKLQAPARIRASYKISNAQRGFEEAYVFEKNVKISILVPLYNTPLKFLKEMIGSVLDQTYKNWELCMTDGSQDAYSYVGEYCKSLANEDSRIKYKKLSENKGISENTNQCLSLATGDYIALFDHDDYLHPSVLFEVMKKITEGADFIYTDEAVFLGENLKNITSCHFKPDYAPDNLLANNYICHFSVFKATLVSSSTLFRSKYDGSQDHDLILRLTDKAKKIAHIPKVLYFWRSHKNSVAMDINSKKYAITAGINAVHDFLESKGVSTVVTSSPAFPTIYRITYEIKGEPKVSIIISNNKTINTVKCVQSIIDKSTYKNLELIIVDKESGIEEIKNQHDFSQYNCNIKLVAYNDVPNPSKIKNYGADHATGDYLLFLSGDTVVISEKWIEELLMYAQREDVGAVGAKLFFDDYTIEHAGIIIGIGPERIASFSHYKCSAKYLGYMGKLFYAQNVSAVSDSCLMVKKSTFNSVNGFSQDISSYYDVDFCLKLRDRNLLNIFNPFCELYHYVSQPKSKALKEPPKSEIAEFMNKWGHVLQKGDPYYNPNFLLGSSYNFRIL